jgi:hypothetical protein
VRYNRQQAAAAAAAAAVAIRYRHKVAMLAEPSQSSFLGVDVLLPACS